MYFPTFKFLGNLNVAIPLLLVLALYVLPLILSFTFNLAWGFPVLFKTLTVYFFVFLYFLDTFLVIIDFLIIIVFLAEASPHVEVTLYVPGFNVNFKVATPLLSTFTGYLLLLIVNTTALFVTGLFPDKTLTLNEVVVS